MYSLDINFLKDRPTYKKTVVEKKQKLSLPTGDLTPVFIGLGLGVSLPVLAVLSVWFLQTKNTELDQIITQLEQEKQQLDVQIGNINKIKEETNQVKAETQALVSVFDQIRPWSAMLQDLRERIPVTVQLENIRQIAPATPVAGQPTPNPAGGVELVGLARSFSDVNDFLLALQKSRFFEASDTKIITADLVDAPVLPGTSQQRATGVPKRPIQLVKYTIQSSLSDVPASELIRELEQKGTVGLVARIRSLQQTGVISK